MKRGREGGRNEGEKKKTKPIGLVYLCNAVSKSITVRTLLKVVSPGWTDLLIKTLDSL